MEVGTVQQVDIDEQMQGAYLDYAMSVIVARALPDVRDGLKPVHRRILYAMHDMGLSPDKPYKKSARIVGEVLGKYHPHGDAAVYESMARMAQDFSLRYVLVDGQGNFGSIDGDSPAAMRYTEARLSSIAGELLADIDKDTVVWTPNFDDTLTEPSVLPALLPNLLVNGTSGIAVGMTTNIPPHNLGEVVDALVFLIDHYSGIDDITVEDLSRFIQGPDFPTGGVVYRYAEEGNGDRIDLIRNAYALGRGHITVQAHLFIEEMSRNRSRIVVTELPYQVNKTRLIERIADLVRDGKLDGVADLRDESDRQGMRICIELTRTVDPRDTLSQLFRLTPMQQTFSLHMLALVDGEPRLLPLKKVLTLYLEHRQEIVTRRSRYLLERARQRAHILEGLLKALDNIDEVVRIIRGSDTTEAARAKLMQRLALSEIQAEAILEMPLKRLVRLERRKTADELKEKQAEIKQLTELLKSPVKIRGAIREELQALKARHGDSRRTRIVDREKGHHTARELVQAHDVALTLWQDGQISMHDVPPRISKSAPIAQVWANTRDDAVLFTATGLAALIPLHQLPEDLSTPASSLVALSASEKIVGLAVLPHAEEGEERPEFFVTLTTRLGRIKRVTCSDLVSGVGRGPVIAMSVEEGDELAWVVPTSGQDELLLVTRHGMAIRFGEAEVRPMGLPAAGVMAVRLEAHDAVAGMGVARAGAFVLTVTEGGLAKRTPVATFPAQKRYGGGVQAAKLSAKTGPIAVAALAGEDQELVLSMAKGRILKLTASRVHPMGRSTGGYHTPQGSAELYFEPEKHGLPVLLAVLPGGRDAREGGVAQAKVPPAVPPASSGRSRSSEARASAKPSAGKRAKQVGPVSTPDQPSAARRAGKPAEAVAPAKAGAIGRAKQPAGASTRKSAAGKASQTATSAKALTSRPATPSKAATPARQPKTKAAAKMPLSKAAERPKTKAAAKTPAGKPARQPTTKTPAEIPASKPAKQSEAKTPAKRPASKPAKQPVKATTPAKARAGKPASSAREADTVEGVDLSQLELPFDLTPARPARGKTRGPE